MGGIVLRRIQPQRAANAASTARPVPAGQAAAAVPEQLFSHRRATLAILGLIVLTVVAATVSLFLGRYPIEPANAVLMLVNCLPFVDMEPTWTNQEQAIFFNVRLPRILLSMLVGCCLAAAGAAYQGTFQNPLTSPDILGASQGAALGAAVAILVGCSSLVVTGAAFASSILAVVVVLLVSARAPGNRITTVVLTGVMVSSLMSAGVSYVKLVADPNDTLPTITYWLIGSLTGARLDDLALAIGPMAVGLVVLFCMRWRINILTMGDDEAETMGVNTRRIRVVIIMAATLVTATSVSLTGIIGWVGLVIPHLARMLVGPDYRVLIPTSMVMGAAFLLVVDDFSRMLAATEIPVGILTALVGAPFFLYLITRKKQAQ